MAGSCARAPEPLQRLRADRQLRYAPSSIRLSISDLHRTEAARHGKVLPMSPDTSVTYLPDRSGQCPVDVRMMPDTNAAAVKTTTPMTAPRIAPTHPLRPRRFHR